jgi:hypothetical protein
MRNVLRIVISSDPAQPRRLEKKTNIAPPQRRRRSQVPNELRRDRDPQRIGDDLLPTAGTRR